MADHSADCNCEQSLRLEARIRELEAARTEYVTKAQCAAHCLEMAMLERSLIVEWLRGRINPHDENPNDDIDCGAARQQGMHEGWWQANDEAIAAIESAAHHATTTPEDAP